MADSHPSLFADLKVFCSRLGAHWREFKVWDLVVVVAVAGVGILVAIPLWWIVVSVFWVVAAVVAFRIWKGDHASLLWTRQELLEAEERLALRSRLDVMVGLLEEGWRLEPLVLHLPTKTGWSAEKLRGVLDRVGRPVLDWQGRVRKELEMTGMGSVAQWDGPANGAGGQSAGTVEQDDSEEAILLRELVQIRTGYFRRVPLLRNIVTAARN